MDNLEGALTPRVFTEGVESGYGGNRGAEVNVQGCHGRGRGWDGGRCGWRVREVSRCRAPCEAGDILERAGGWRTKAGLFYRLVGTGSLPGDRRPGTVDREPGMVLGMGRLYVGTGEWKIKSLSPMSS